jgi:hypothetical protein
MKYSETQLKQVFIHSMSDKERFLRWFYVTDSIASAVRTRKAEFPFYARETKERDREIIKVILRNYLLNLWPDASELDKAEIKRAITALQEEGTQRFGLLLCDGKFRLGISQKMVCLYAKYLWVSGQLKSPPPLIPYDGVVKSALKNPDLKDWTELDDWDDYEDILKAIDKVSQGQPAEWELRIWNESVMKALV